MSVQCRKKINIQYLDTQCGELILGSYEGALVLCDWRYRKKREGVDKRIQTLLDADYIETEDSVLEQARRELAEYFRGERKVFSVALLFAGTEFQQQVWQQLCQIEYGKTLSYLALAQKLGDANKVRAVATANGANAISIIVPCHRIIGSDGKLVGYAGGLAAKEKLLHLEACTLGDTSLRQSLSLF